MPETTLKIPHAFFNRLMAHSESGGVSRDRYLIGALETYLDMPDCADLPLTPTGSTVTEFVTLDLPEELKQKLIAAHGPALSLQDIVWNGLSAYFDELDERYASVPVVASVEPQVYARFSAQAAAAECSVSTMARRAVYTYIFTAGNTDFPNRMLQLPDDLTGPEFSDALSFRLSSDCVTKLEDMMPQHAENSGRNHISGIITRAISFYSNSIGAPIEESIVATPPFQPSATARITTKKLRL